MDEEPAKPPRLFDPPLLDRLGRAELTAYIAVLRDEIARVEAELARKSRHVDAAEAVFGKRG